MQKKIILEGAIIINCIDREGHGIVHVYKEQSSRRMAIEAIDAKNRSKHVQ